MIEKVLHPRNLTKAYRQVVSNKGSAGIDGMKTDQLKSFIDSNRSVIATNILTRRYSPQAIKGRRECKENVPLDIFNEGPACRDGFPNQTGKPDY
jgi:RNA-directed DNA polymerase